MTPNEFTESLAKEYADMAKVAADPKFQKD